MKKVFLSLAAITLVATGSLTMTSCGSDDSTPPVVNDDNTPIDGNKFVYDGQTYVLDANSFMIQGQDNQFSLGEYNYEEGGESYVVTEWSAEAYPETAEGEQPEYFIRILFDVEAKDNGDETYSLQMPHEAENVFPYQILTVENGALLSNTEYAYGSVDLDFNNFVLGESSLSVDYTSDESVNGVQFNFSGASGLSIFNWQNVPAEKAAKNSVKEGSKLRSQNVKIGALKLSK